MTLKSGRQVLVNEEKFWYIINNIKHWNRRSNTIALYHKLCLALNRGTEVTVEDFSSSARRGCEGIIRTPQDRMRIDALPRGHGSYRQRLHTLELVETNLCHTCNVVAPLEHVIFCCQERTNLPREESKLLSALQDLKNKIPAYIWKEIYEQGWPQLDKKSKTYQWNH